MLCAQRSLSASSERTVERGGTWIARRVAPTQHVHVTPSRAVRCKRHRLIRRHTCRCSLQGSSVHQESRRQRPRRCLRASSWIVAHSVLRAFGVSDGAPLTTTAVLQPVSTPVRCLRLMPRANLIRQSLPMDRCNVSDPSVHLSPSSRGNAAFEAGKRLQRPKSQRRWPGQTQRNPGAVTPQGQQCVLGERGVAIHGAGLGSLRMHATHRNQNNLTVCSYAVAMAQLFR